MASSDRLHGRVLSRESPSFTTGYIVLDVYSPRPIAANLLYYDILKSLHLEHGLLIPHDALGRAQHMEILKYFCIQTPARVTEPATRIEQM